ncbi:MAG: hypothetical protein AAF694_00700 [Bacteroidota bacterium]
MMHKRILLAESGATKTDWRLCEKGKVVQRFSSIGFNPSSLSQVDLQQAAQNVFSIHSLDFPPTSIHFFGAGLRNSHPRNQMQSMLRGLFPEVEQIWVGDDLQAACLATQRTKGIVAILGTGSNACEFDGGKITRRRGGLGYILGDEGSGVDLGKHLLIKILQGDFTENTERVILDQLQMDRETLRNQLYTEFKPVKWLGSLARTVHAFKHLPEICEMIIQRFGAFIQGTLAPLPHSRKYPVDFVGSIAIHFQEELISTLQKAHIQQGKIISDPIERLVEVLTYDDFTDPLG